jgi:DNA repair ATPase RecN
MILFDIKSDLYGPPSNEREDSNAFQARLTVSAVFDQVEPLQAQLACIASFGEPIRRLGELANVFGELRKFAMQVSDLARVLESMHNFQDRLRPVPNQFAPLEALDETLKRLCSSFAEHLSELAAALAPAVTLQDQLSYLAGAFEPAKVLREEFMGLAQSFALRSPAMSDGRNTASSPSNPRRAFSLLKPKR